MSPRNYAAIPSAIAGAIRRSSVVSSSGWLSGTRLMRRLGLGQLLVQLKHLTHMLVGLVTRTFSDSVSKPLVVVIPSR